MIAFDPYTSNVLFLANKISTSGFAAEAPVNALQTLSTESTQYKPDIEEDKVVSANGEFEGEKHSF